MDGTDIGYHESRKSSSGIRSYRTTGQLRAWLIPREIAALKSFNDGVGCASMPGIYVLVGEKNNIYIGETKNLYKRLEQHQNSPKDEIADWYQSYLISDGRMASLSLLNDDAVRKSIEKYLKDLFLANKYKVVSGAEKQELNMDQKPISDSFNTELLLFFIKQNLITKGIENIEEREVYSDELQQVLTSVKYRVEDFKEKEAMINGKKTFIRQGSKKQKGYQVTIRGGRPGSFIAHLREKDGFLLIRRGLIPMIPLERINEFVKEENPDVFKNDTVDVFLEFKDGRAFLNYRRSVLDVTEYGLR